MGYVTSLFARKMVAAAGAGVDGDALLRQLGLDPAGPWDPRTMVPATRYYDLLEQIAAQVDATDLPVRVGASMRCDEYGALGLALKAARDLNGALSRVVRYARLWTGVVGYELRPDPRGVLYLLHRPGARRLGLRLSNETTLVATVALAREISAGPVVPLEVRVAHAAPSARGVHEDWFGCPVRFDAGMDALLFDPETMAAPNRLGDEGISRYLVSHLESELSALAEEPPLVAAAREAIAQSLSGGPPRMEEIARGLGLSGRSFHRRLSEHGMSFQALTEATRRDLALGLLGDATHSLAEVAFLTGFSEQSAFTRAFKRWVGTTPASYRRAHPPR
ncbi:AraC family transcriptional regulator [Pseudoponticoccus marisrubri]|uniref:AraC family transcriptional regulator n=2 Tax=Pseudoponticoccus marisrubri TaxID=1685382 RepID=A0A0W7WIG5_9RHOB|nr:AraC family transcriptional regulator [Pseudoponticoccus marisrubri]